MQNRVLLLSWQMIKRRFSLLQRSSTKGMRCRACLTLSLAYTYQVLSGPLLYFLTGEN